MCRQDNSIFRRKHMDVVIAALGTVDEMKAYRVDMRERVAAQGRNPDDCKVFFLLTPTLGDTDAEAQARYERNLHAKSEPVEQWHEVIGDNPTLGDAILDRLIHNAHRLAMTGESMRKIAGKRSLDASRDP